MTCRVPRDEELLEDVVQELSPLARTEASLFVPFFVEAEHVAREVLERAVEIPLDVADRIHRWLARPGVAVERRIRRGRSRRPELEPRSLFFRQRFREAIP